MFPRIANTLPQQTLRLLRGRVEVPVKSDNNCIFRSFASGLGGEIGRMEEYYSRRGGNLEASLSDFLSKTSSFLNLPANDWSTIKGKIMSLSSAEEELQSTFAPVLRDLAIDLESKNPSQKDNTIPYLLEAFDQYCQNGERRAIGGALNGEESQNKGKDDIFKYHRFIREKFEELKNDPMAIDSLIVWWHQEGFQRFLDEMRLQANWGGDLELSELARYFHVNLKILKDQDDFVYHAYVDVGSMPRNLFTEDQVTQLVARGVIEHPASESRELKLLELSREEIELRLAAVPQSEALMEYIFSQQLLKGKPLPPQFESSIAQLKARQVVFKASSDSFYHFILSCEEAMRRILPIDGRAEVLKAWESNYLEAPSIFLKHYAVNQHWTCFKEVKTLIPRPVLAASPLEQSTSLWSSMREMAIGASKWLWSAYSVFRQPSAMRAHFLLSGMGSIRIAADPLGFIRRVGLHSVDEPVSAVLAQNQHGFFAAGSSKQHLRRKNTENPLPVQRQGYCNLL